MMKRFAKLSLLLVLAVSMLLLSSCGSNSSMGTWTKQAYLDEFNQETDLRYVSIKANGTYSNPSVSGVKMVADMIVDLDKIEFQFRENDVNMLVNLTGMTDGYEILVSDKNGEKYTFSGQLEDNAIQLNVRDRASMLAVLTEGGNIKFAIKSNNSDQTRYNFEITADNFESTAADALYQAPYQKALALKEQGEYVAAIETFESLDNYSDSAEQIAACQKAINDADYAAAKALMDEGKYEEAITAFEALDGYSDSADQITACQTAIMDGKYAVAKALMDEGKYDEAITAFEALDGYSDSSDQIEACKTAIKVNEYAAAKALMDEGKYEEAIAAFEALDGYSDSTEQIEACKTAIKDNEYAAAKALMGEGKYEEAIAAFKALDGYSDSAAQIEACQEAIYSAAKALMDKGKYEEAVAVFESLNDYSDASEKRKEAAKGVAEEKQAEFDYSSATQWFAETDDAQSQQYAKNRAYAVKNATEWQAVDTQYGADRKELPENVYIYKTGGYYSDYGILKATPDGWATGCDYEWIYYYPDQQMICCGTRSSCTLIDLVTDSVSQISECKSIFDVSENGVLYKLNSLYGFADRSGNIIVEPMFEDAQDFSDGMAAVKLNGLWGYIDSYGNMATEFEFKKAESFQSGYAKVYMDSHRVKENDLYVTYDSGYGLIDKTGKHVIEPQWDELNVNANLIANGAVVVSDGSKYGMLDLSGNTVLAVQYDTIGTFSEDLCYVRILKEGETYYPCTTAGWVNGSGEMVIDLVAMGYGGVYGEDDYTFINGVTAFSYWDYYLAGYGSYHYYASNGIFSAVINNKGEILWKGDTDDDSAYQRDNGDITVYKGFSHDESTTYSTANGSLVEKNISDNNGFRSQWGVIYDYSEEGIARVSLNTAESRKEGTYGTGPYGYITIDDTVLVDPIYSDACDFRNGYAAVCLDGKWGYINTSGEYVIEPQYSDVSSGVTATGTAFAKTGEGKYILIDMAGNTLLSGISDVISGNFDFTGTFALIKGYAGTSNWVLINENGERVF